MEDECYIFTPIEGSVIPIEKVNDTMFQELLDDEFAIVPKDSSIYSLIGDILVQYLNRNLKLELRVVIESNY